MLLNFEKTKKLLEKYEIPLAEGKIISSCAEALAFARATGFPVKRKNLLYPLAIKFCK